MWDGGDAVLLYEDVSFAYPSASGPVCALDSVSLSLAPGEMLAVLGANGSGKSTLARLANGIELPDSGRVTVDTMSTSDPGVTYEVRSSVGIVFQHPDDQIVATSVEDDVAFGPENLGLERVEIRRRVDGAISAVGLAGLERREPHLLSGGQKQRLAIAGALAMHPRYLVLDEPTSMLDPVGRAEVLDVVDGLAAAGHGVLLITHDLDEAMRADRAVVLTDGRVVFSGSPRELVEDSRLAAWSLALSPELRLRVELRSLGVPVSVGSSRDELLAALCR